VLLDNSASPLQHALETTELGRAPSPLCGLEDSMRELVFCCGIEGSEAEHADALEDMVLAVLERVALEGVSQQRLEAVLHQLELHQREVTGDGYPFGLQLILQALGCATHYSDPIAVLNLEPVIVELQQKIQDPDYIRQLARRLLLDNPHRVTLVMTPDTELSAHRLAQETARLADIKAAMSDAQRSATVQLAADLSARQAQVDDDSILPKVELSDVPATLPEPTFTKTELHGIPFTTYGQGTNGIVYQQGTAPLPALSAEQLQILPLYTNILTDVGLGDQSYMEVQERQAATVGSIAGFVSMRGHADDEQRVSANFTLSSKALLRNARDQAQLMSDTLHRVKFSETSRIRDLVNQQRARRDQSITGSGHSLAMAAASAGMSPLASMHHHQSGLAGIRQLRILDDSLADDTRLEAFALEVQKLHETLISTPMQFLVIAEDHKVTDVARDISTLWSQVSTGEDRPRFQMTPIREQRGEIWLTNTQVNFCARAYPPVTEQHPDAAALTVLGGFLRNGFLHRAIREQGGAYGGGASHDSGIAAFRFYSYRDPRLVETLQDFDASVSWLLDTPHDDRSLEEAILGVIGSMDKPGSPAGEAKQHFHNRLFGRNHETRERFRENILGVSLDDLRRVTETYLRPDLASTAIVTNSGQLEATASLREELNLSVQEL
jgi:hypothetical protein